MQITTLRLRSFRAHSETEVGFAPKVNLLYGPNGAGKTNVLEAIHALALSKSFLTGNDGHVLRRGAPHFEVEGHFEGVRRPGLEAKLVYVPGEGKRIFLNRTPLDRLADVVGRIPVVVIQPADIALTADGPEERRKFIDNTLSQARPVYLDDLLKYRRALRQRNALLLALRRRSGDPGALEAWDAELVLLGARIIRRRARFLTEFARFLAEAYDQLGAIGEEPTLEYDTVMPLEGEPDEGAIAEAFRSRLARVARRERERGRTLLGPHRDEVVFRLNGFEIRPYGSQGQHRTFSLALGLAKYAFLNEVLEEPPILLLDDLFGPLDDQRTRVVLDLLQSSAVGQTLITAARRDPFDRAMDLGAPEHCAMEIVNGAPVVPAATG